MLKRNWWVAALAVVLLGGIAINSPRAAEKAQPGPQVIAAIFHADWCATCKKMGPDVMATQAQYAGSPVLFVKFDRTDEKTTNQSALMASALGIGETFAANEKTGFVLLLDGKTKKVVGSLSAQQTAPQMSAAIKAALNGKTKVSAKTAPKTASTGSTCAH